MTALRAGELLGHRYVLLEPLGEGASAVVFRARDRRQDRDVALKLLMGEDAVALARREHELAHDAVHPSIARALDVGRDGAHAFVVFELAEGDALDRAIEGRDPASLALALDELLGALAFLHGRGVVHGDLKPAHVRVRFEDGRPRARLLDLGLARAAGERGGGNTAYGAPESLGGGATPESDLFGAGAIAFEALTGALPFGDPSDPGYLARLVAGAIVERELPPSLAPIVRRLLAADPRARFRSALEARAALRTAASDAIEVLPEPIAAPPLIGRDEVLTRARELVDRAEPVVLAGAAGSGRSRVLARIASDARLLGMATIELDATRGLGALVEVIARELALLGAPITLEGDLADLTGDRASAVLFALVDALRAVRCRVLVAVDDLDRADASTRRAIRFLAGAPSDGHLAWALVDARPRGGSVLALEPLDAAQIERVVSAMLPGLPEAALLARSAEAGEPARVVEGVLRLASAGAVRFCETGWRASADGFDAALFLAPTPSRARERIALLREEDRGLLGALALAGGSFEVAAARLGVRSGDLRRAERAAIHAGLIRQTPTGAAFSAGHVAGALVELLDERARADVHGRLVHALRGATAIDDRAARATSLAALGRADEAAEEALAAADIALSRGQPSIALSLMVRASRWGGAPVVSRVALREAELRAAQGELDGALAALERGAEAGVPHADVARARGRILARAGRYDDAIEALATLESPGPEERYWLGWSLMMRGRYDEASALASGASCGAGDRARLGRLAGTIAWHRGRIDDACGILRTARADAIDAGDPLVRVEVEQSLGTAERIRGRLGEAGARFREAVRLAREHGFAALLAKCLNNLAINEYQAGVWDEAARAWEAMRELALRLDAKEEILLAHNNLALLYRDRGELDRAKAALTAALVIAREQGLTRYEAMVLGNLADVHTLAGELDRARESLDAAEAHARAIEARGELLECAVRRAALALASSEFERALSLATDTIERASEASLERGNAACAGASAARALGRLEEAAALVTLARGAFAAGGTRLEQARAELEDAKLCAARREPAAAKEKARAAARVFAELGAARELADARALEDQDEVAERGHALLELLRVASSAVDVDALLEGVLDRVLALTHAERGFVLLLEGERAPSIAALRGVTEGEVPRLSRGIADRVVASGKALVLANIGDELSLASRESVMGMGLRAALCAPLVRGERCLGLLYVDSRRGPELVRFGLWMIDAAAAILVPALERLLDAELDRERLSLLRGSAAETLETLSSVHAALSLLDAEHEERERRAWVASARDHVERAVARTEGLLDLLRVTEERPRDEREAVDLASLLTAAAPGASLDLAGAPPRIAGGLEPLSSLVTHMAQLVARQASDPAEVVVSARALDASAAPGTSAWRPGESAGRPYVRIEAWTSGPALRRELLDSDASAEAIALRAARRLARRCGGRLVRMDDGARFGLLAELLASEEAA